MAATTEYLLFACSSGTEAKPGDLMLCSHCRAPVHWRRSPSALPREYDPPSAVLVGRSAPTMMVPPVVLESAKVILESATVISDNSSSIAPRARDQRRATSLERFLHLSDRRRSCRDPATHSSVETCARPKLEVG